jgi:hypothetical protein
VSAVDTSRPDTIARRPRSGTTADTATVSTGRQQHAVRRTPSSGQPPTPTSRLCCQRGHRMWRLASPAVAGGRCMDARPPATAISLPCSGGCGRVRGSARPSGQHLAAIPDVQPTLPRCPVPWTPAGVPGQVAAAGSHRRPTVRQRTQPCGHPQPAGGRHGGHPRLRRGTRTLRHGHADTAAAAGWTAGSATVHCCLHVRPGTGPQGAAPASIATVGPCTGQSTRRTLASMTTRTAVKSRCRHRRRPPPRS